MNDHSESNHPPHSPSCSCRGMWYNRFSLQINKGVLMKRAVLCLLLPFITIMFFSSFACAGEVQVSIIGGDDLTSLAPGIKQTVTARCIARGVNLDDHPGLSISILQMGDALSFDAILGTTPPNAFHTDLTDKSALSSAIDEMITKLFFTTPAVQQQPQTVPAAPQQSGQTREDIRLPFIATSLTVLDAGIYISDETTIYILKDAQVEPWWQATGKNRIFRIYTHKDSIIALVKRGNIFNTYQIKGGEILQHWNTAVIPIGTSLVSSQITSDTDMPNGINKWAELSKVAGDLPLLPEGVDIPTVALGDILPSHHGLETISFNRSNYLTINSSDKTIWSSETALSTLPLYLEQDIYADDPPVRYYMRPRILVQDGEIITIQNDRGMSKIFGNVILFDGADILAFSAENSDFEDRSLTHIRKYFCADIAIHDKTLIALVIKKKESAVRFIDL